MADEMVATGRSVDIRNTGEYVKLRAAYTKLKQDHAVALTRIEKAEADLQARTEELTAARGAIDQNQLLKDNAALKLQIRTDRHRAIFTEKAKAAGVKANALNDLWSLSGYKADTDEPNTAAMDAAIEAQRAARDYLFAPPTSEEGAQPGPGRGQGGADRGNGKWKVTADQLANPQWCRDNRQRLDKALAEGTVEMT